MLSGQTGLSRQVAVVASADAEYLSIYQQLAWDRPPSGYDVRLATVNVVPIFYNLFHRIDPVPKNLGRLSWLKLDSCWYPYGTRTGNQERGKNQKARHLIELAGLILVAGARTYLRLRRGK